MPKPVKKARPLFKTPPKPKRPPDPNRAAQAAIAEHMARIQGQPAADQMILDPETVIREHMRKIGAEGGKVSGARREKNLSEAERKRIASLGGKKKAANAKARARAQRAALKARQP